MLSAVTGSGFPISAIVASLRCHMPYGWEGRPDARLSEILGPLRYTQRKFGHQTGLTSGLSSCGEYYECKKQCSNILKEIADENLDCFQCVVADNVPKVAYDCPKVI